MTQPVDAVYDPAPSRAKAAKHAAKPPVRRESNVVSDVIALIQSLPRGHARKTHGSAFTQSGEPDVDGCVNGRAVKLEGKKMTGKASGTHPTGAQNEVLRRWAATGALVGWFRTVAHATALLDHLDELDFVPDLDRPGCSCPRHGGR